MMVALPFEYAITKKHLHPVKLKSGKRGFKKVNAHELGSCHYAVGQPMGMLSS
jgi:hypothetical protein